MRVGVVKELFRSLTAEYFAHANVIFSEQSRIAKPELALVTIRFGNVSRPYRENNRYVDGEPVGYYLSKVEVTVDNFTHGSPLYLLGADKPYAYENTAEADLLEFVDFLNSQHTQDWCTRNDLTIIVNNEVTDMTGIVNDSNYEFRARLVLQIYFTHYSVGKAGVLLESSLVGQPGNQHINPHSKITSSGGGSEALSDEQVGYFEDAEITEEDNE